MREKYLSDKRVLEVDLLRGIAVLLMAFQHFVFDFRHVFHIDIFQFQDTVWFMDWFRPIIVFLFLMMSGISSSFSKNNVKRGAKLLFLSLALTAVLEIISLLLKMELHIYFNVFHVLSFGILLYALLMKFEQKQDTAIDYIALILIFVSTYILYLGQAVDRTNPISHNFLLPFGLYSYDVPSMLDYMPLIPWIGMFFIGVAIGRLFYRQKKSLLPQKTKEKLANCRVILFLGRHALAFYIIHQLAFLMLIYLGLNIASILGFN